MKGQPIRKKKPVGRSGAPQRKKKKIGKKNQKAKNSETKNIPKNYGKQIIKFARGNEKLIKKVLD